MFIVRSGGESLLRVLVDVCVLLYVSNRFTGDPKSLVVLHDAKTYIRRAHKVGKHGRSTFPIGF